jgi:hypothetical protein
MAETNSGILKRRRGLSRQQKGHGRGGAGVSLN